MPNKVVVVTGATSGIGKALAMDLAKKGETIILIARNADRGRAALQELGSGARNPNIDLQLCDLSVLASVRTLADALTAKYETIDVLINNASIYRRDREVTADGFEEMFAANHLGPFLLTNLLLRSLQAAAQAHGSARILNITAPSTVPLNFDDLQGKQSFNSLRAFGATKTANLLFTFELARRLENTGVTVNAIHPGLTRSGLMKEASVLMRLLSRLVSSPPEKVSKTILPVALAPEFQHVTGKFLHYGREIKAFPYAYERSVQQALWEISEVLTSTGSTSLNGSHA